MFQKAVNFDTAFGVPGELSNLGPTRVETGVLKSADPANNVFGRVFSENPAVPGEWSAGAGGRRLAILVNPKEHVSYGTAGNTLAPTLALPNGTVASFLTMGELWAVSTTAANPGDKIQFDATTGAITAVAPTAPDTPTTWLGAIVARYPGVANGVFGLRITD